MFNVNHLARHAAVKNEIGAGHEAGAFAIEKIKDEFGNIRRPTYPAGPMLGMVLIAILPCTVSSL